VNSKLKGKDVDNVDTAINGPPYYTSKKRNNPDEPLTDEKFMKGGVSNKGAKRGKVSGGEKSSGESDVQRGPVINY
jgi:hypothetical protein